MTQTQPEPDFVEREETSRSLAWREDLEVFFCSMICMSIGNASFYVYEYFRGPVPYLEPFLVSYVLAIALGVWMGRNTLPLSYSRRFIGSAIFIVVMLAGQLIAFHGMQPQVFMNLVMLLVIPVLFSLAVAFQDRNQRRKVIVTHA